MTESNSTEQMINEGGDIAFPDIAALTLATVLWLTRGDDKVINEIGTIADQIKERFQGNDTSGDQ
jgi:hypothetical protein